MGWRRVAHCPTTVSSSSARRRALNKALKECLPDALFDKLVSREVRPADRGVHALATVSRSLGS
jgi:hypothetical protein